MTTESEGKIYLGVDTGGTFTDLILVQGKRIATHKLPSTPRDPSLAVLEGIRELTDQADIVFHGSTVATNALLEGKTARVGLVTTVGFRDLLLIGRQNRAGLYDLHPRGRRSLVAPDDVVEVNERNGADGSVLRALEEQEIDRVVSALAARNITSVALCLLHSYANPEHERMIEERLRERGVVVSRSSTILPEYREFERASTTAVNAAVSPVMSRYLRRIEDGLGTGNLRIMQSNGGAIDAEVAGSEAVRTILSGPAGGIVGAQDVARSLALDNILTFDMGGTSTDVALCAGEIPFTSETVIAGWPVKVPMIAIHTVGAGGGSIARRDSGGALRVGPESAGADPGPVCYGRGERVTVTDANLFLGRLLPDRFLGGRMTLDRGRCRDALEQLARELGMAAGRLAEGIVEVAEETMTGALRVVSIEKGFDPRDFTLFPFGGAGGLHACSLAQKLGMTRILIPRFPGLLSAAGMLLSDTIRDYSLSVLRPAVIGAEEVRDFFAPLARRAATDLDHEGVPAAERRLEYGLDLRYRGQSFEVTVPLASDYVENFHAEHHRLYGYRDRQRAVEIVNLRLRAVGVGPRPRLWPPLAPGNMPAPITEAVVTLAGKEQACPVYERDQLPPGGEFSGPALVVEATATHLIRPRWRVRVTAPGHLLVTRRSP